MFGNVFFRDFNYKMVTHARVFALTFTKGKLNNRTGLYVATQLFYLNKVYSYNNMASWNKINEEKIILPITAKGGINFSYMEKFIAELEAERIAELEAYLKLTGLSNYNLTRKEEDAISKISLEGGVEHLNYKLFRISSILNWQVGIKEINPMKLNELEDKSQYCYPFYGQSTTNNGIISYERLCSDVLNNKETKPTILIHSNNQNVVYLEEPFYLKDGHGATSVLQAENLNERNAFFIMASIQKVISKKFSYANKATKIALKETKIKLPTKNGKIDYDFMGDVISGIQKLVIKSVIDYKDEVIQTSKDIIS